MVTEAQLRDGFEVVQMIDAGATLQVNRECPEVHLGQHGASLALIVCAPAPCLDELGQHILGPGCGELEDLLDRSRRVPSGGDHGRGPHHERGFFGSQCLRAGEQIENERACEGELADRS